MINWLSELGFTEKGMKEITGEEIQSEILSPSTAMSNQCEKDMQE